MAKAITSVGGTALSEKNQPSSYQWKLEDVSKPNAGRTEDGEMHKLRMRQVVGIELSWQNITTAQAKTILTAFNPEYINVTYLDPMGNPATNYYTTKKFYVGDRSAPLYNATLGLWSNVSFNIIEV